MLSLPSGAIAQTVAMGILTCSDLPSDNKIENRTDIASTSREI